MRVLPIVLFATVGITAAAGSFAAGAPAAASARDDAAANRGGPQVITEQAEMEQLAHQYHVAASPSERAHIREEQVNLEWTHLKHELPLFLQLQGGVAGMGDVESDSAGRANGTVEAP